MSADRAKGGVMRKTAPTCKSHTAEGKKQDNYQACVSHHAGECDHKRSEVKVLLSTLHTGTPPEKHRQRNSY